MSPEKKFNYCPSCGSKREGEPKTPFTCFRCGFVYYFNPNIAATAIIARSDGSVLIITRAKEPAKGKLAYPGGFIDIGETAEAALRRETREEVNLEIHDLELLCSSPNHYEFKGVTYPVLDFVFAAKTSSDKHADALDGVARIEWRNPADISLDELAFPSLREGMRVYRNLHR